MNAERAQREYMLLVLERERYRVETARHKMLKAKREADVAALVLASVQRDISAAQVSKLRRVLCWLGLHRWQSFPTDNPIARLCTACPKVRQST